MAPIILLAAVGIVMLCRGLLTWRAEGKRSALVGAAMTLAAASVYFSGQGHMAAAYACGVLLAASILAALVTGGRSWAKPEVILGIAAVAALLGSRAIAEGSAQWTLMIVGTGCGVGSILLTLRAVVADMVTSQRG